MDGLPGVFLSFFMVGNDNRFSWPLPFSFQHFSFRSAFHAGCSCFRATARTMMVFAGRHAFDPKRGGHEPHVEHYIFSQGLPGFCRLVRRYGALFDTSAFAVGIATVGPPVEVRSPSPGSFPRPVPPTFAFTDDGRR